MPYVYSAQKSIYIEEVLIKLNVCIFWEKIKKSLINIMKFGNKLAMLSKKINRELICNKKCIFWGKKLKKFFLKCIFWGSNFREKFWKIFWLKLATDWDEWFLLVIAINC